MLIESAVKSGGHEHRVEAPTGAGVGCMASVGHCTPDTVMAVQFVRCDVTHDTHAVQLPEPSGIVDVL